MANKDLTQDELFKIWLENREKELKTNKNYVQAYENTSSENKVLSSKNTWNWFSFLIQDDENLYTAIRHLMNQNSLLKNALTSFLNLPKDSDWGQINERAKDIGSFNETLLRKKEEEEDNFKKLKQDG